MDIPVSKLFVAAGLWAIAIAFFGFTWWALSARPKTKVAGEWVAEVWLNWEICAGSTMYRQRFKTKWGAYLAVRARAFVLDFVLPRFYWDTDWCGKRVSYKHEYSIHYGVRSLSELERSKFNPVYSVALPGEAGSTAEPSCFRLAILDSLQLEENGIVG